MAVNLTSFGEAAILTIAGLLAIVVSIVVRSAFLRASMGSAVDHYYWIIAARAYRSQSKLPVRIPGKYLLEDDRQAYPPGFGWTLSFFSDEFLRSLRSVFFVVVIDGMTLLVILCVSAAIGVEQSGAIVVILVYGLAPVLVAYNTQLTSRGMGNLFLVLSLSLQAAAAASTGFQALVYGSFGAVMLAAVFLTHKMTTQFFLFLWLLWPFALSQLGPWGAWIAVWTPFVALALSTLVTGTHFQILQWQAHWDIVSFWMRNWRFLGAHQFQQSPIYGDADRSAMRAFHRPGAAGALHHFVLLASYLPIALPLPVTLFYTVSPPAFVLVWFSAAIAAAVLTLYVPALKCLGGGHFYLFNAVPPTALWWGFAISQSGLAPPLMILLNIGLIATGISLWIGMRRRSRVRKTADADVEQLVSRLAREPSVRVAVFPVIYAERIALETDHSLFWGGHGIGFRVLEKYWPIMREPLSKVFSDWNIRWAIIDLEWWPKGEDVFAAETGNRTPERIGRFALYKIH